MRGKIVASVVVTCIVTIRWCVFQTLQSRENRFYVGAYLIYSIVGGGGVPRFTFSGTIRIEITEVTEKTYTVYITHDMAVDGELRVVRPETRTYYFDEPMIFNFRKGTRYAGDETINTALGTKEVARYVYEDGRVRQDIYVDKDSNLLLAEYEKSTSAADTDAYLRISQTNIGWLEAP